MLNVMNSLDFTVSVVQMRSVPGNVQENLSSMLASIRLARRQGSKLVVFPELATSGYMLGDRWEHDAFIREIEAANEQIRRASRGLVVVWGSVRADWERTGEDGRVRKYNAAMIAHNGEWVSNSALTGWVPKTNLPKYRMFDDARHFYPAGSLVREMSHRGVDKLWQLLRPFRVMIDGKQVSLGLAVCEDFWDDEYNEKPASVYGMHYVDLAIDISHSPWTAEKWHARDGMLTRRSRDVKAPILYVNAVGLQNNAKNLVWFDGNSALVDKDGTFRWRAPQNDEGLHLVHLGNLPPPEAVRGHNKGIAEIFEAQVRARRAFYALFPRVVTGLSGGIDSAVDLALNVEALGADKMLAINMPTEHNSQTTRSLAMQCAKNLGVEYRISPIQAVYEAELAAHAELGYEPAMLVKENIQARARGHRLAGIAAEVGGVFTCNGNKTEVALNYFTLYGDGAGAGAFLADLWKGQIYELARYINERAGRELIPQGIIDIVPSAELSPEQNVDEGKGDPIFYPYHDNLLRMFIERRSDPTEVLQHYVAGDLDSWLGAESGMVAKYFKTDEAFVTNLEWAWRSYNIEYKRHQLPPVFIASRRAFGFDRRDTIAEGFYTSAYKKLKQTLLAEAA